MNKVHLNGRLTKDPEMRYSQGNEPMAIARFNLAVARKFGSQQQGQQDTDFVQMVSFGKIAESIEKHLKQGMKILITGRIQTGSYVNKDGFKVFTTEVVIEDWEFDEPKSKNQSTTQGQPAPQQQAPQYQQPAPQGQPVPQQQAPQYQQPAPQGQPAPQQQAPQSQQPAPQGQPAPQQQAPQSQQPAPQGQPVPQQQAPQSQQPTPQGQPAPQQAPQSQQFQPIPMSDIDPNSLGFY